MSTVPATELDTLPIRVPDTMNPPINKNDAMRLVRRINQAIDAVYQGINLSRKLILEFYESQGWKLLGYKTFKECVEVEIKIPKTTFYRELHGALIERSLGVSDDSEPLPTKTLLALKPIGDPEERKEVLTKATAATGGKVTERDVVAAVREHQGNDAEGYDEPSEVETQDLEEKSHSGTFSEEEDPTQDAEHGDAWEEPESGSPERQSERSGSQPDDISWIKKLPLYEKLSGKNLNDFVRNALAYRDLDKARKNFRVVLHTASGHVERDGATIGPWLYRMLKAFRMNGPEKWVLCKDCGGDGRNSVVGQGGKCPTCHGDGYRV